MDSNMSSTVTDNAGNEFDVVETFDWRDPETVSLGVVESVAAVRNVDPTELRPLASVVDTDALNTLFTSTPDAQRRSGYVQFEYEQCRITVTANGQILVERA